MWTENPSYPALSRTNLERTITKIGVKATNSDVSPDVSYSANYDKYRELGRIFNTNWVEVLNNSCPENLYPKSDDDKRAQCEASINYLHRKDSGVRHGFDVTGMIVGMSVAAYNRWRPTQSRSIEELVAMQKNPKTIQGIPLMLAQKPNDINKYFEEALCLFDGAYSGAMQHDYPTIRAFKREGEKIGAFHPDLISVIQQFGHEVVAATGEPDQSCPAQRFIPILWTSMVDYCTQDQRFFATDLGIV